MNWLVVASHYDKDWNHIIDVDYFDTIEKAERHKYVMEEKFEDGDDDNTMFYKVEIKKMNIGESFQFICYELDRSISIKNSNKIHTRFAAIPLKLTYIHDILD